MQHVAAKPTKRRKRKAKRRICPTHGVAMVWRPNEHGESWRCPDPLCGMRVGRASTPCDAATGRERLLLHDAFDPLWQHGRVRKFSTRGRAYGWLAGELGISRRECHIGRFTAAMCRRAAEAIEELLGRS